MGRCEFQRKRKVFHIMLHESNLADFGHGQIEKEGVAMFTATDDHSLHDMD
ncbi:unnamed protein product [Sphenostylis stenocarpa]|uniref:Uncharacterized protein n=1 Tax=Sphenostylis stenocarpa TaxID=92480 RepID=A0AA86S460_9FABA|nr:unnamed protein product [Sphenostylis stenocarpa]